MNVCIAFFLPLIVPFALCSEIVFPSSITTRSKSCYLPQYDTHGKCVTPAECNLIGTLTRHNRFSELLCDNRNNLICCPEKLDMRPPKIIDISKPTSVREGCGGIYLPGFTSSLRLYYRANDTADDLEALGFNISGHDMISEDTLHNFDFSNGTFNSNFSDTYGYILSAIGGEAARRVVTIYMAIIGKKARFGDTVDWLCDGVLINHEWVLTAAHCFSADLDIVRLGEYNLTDNDPWAIDDPQDYDIKTTVLYPKYKFPAVYHDLALIQLSRRTYLARPDINPVCLPWGKELQVDLLNRQITLTGWGSTFFGGPISNIPQEVNVTVFDVGVCEKGYSTLRDYSEKFPTGMRNVPILCAGDESGGKDACQGDSGAPVVYLSDDDTYTLAGIVSAGHGCGLKDFPGIYTPIAVPEYLNWIKNTAFPPDTPELLP